MSAAGIVSPSANAVPSCAEFQLLVLSALLNAHACGAASEDLLDGVCRYLSGAEGIDTSTCCFASVPFIRCLGPARLCKDSILRCKCHVEKEMFSAQAKKSSAKKGILTETAKSEEASYCNAYWHACTIEIVGCHMFTQPRPIAKHVTCTARSM